MSSETFSPTQAAKQTGVPLSTLRVWCGQYAEFLSETASPGPSVPRRLTMADCETLRAISRMRDNGLEPAQIVTRLRDNPSEALQTPLAAPTDAPQQPTAIISAQSAPDALASFVVASDARLADVAKRVESLDRRLAASEDTRRFVIGVLLAFAVGVLVTGVIALLLR